jgi:undecaprenyl-diphosphatase
MKGYAGRDAGDEMDGRSAVRQGAHDTGVGTPRYARSALVSAAVASVGFAATTALVAAERTQGLDDRTKHLFRPHDEWGPTQLRYDHVVEGLSPEHLVVLLAFGTLLAVVTQRSWSPLVLVVPTLAVTAFITWSVKVLMSRPDPTGGISDTGGSYPSGHMAFLIVCGGLLVMLLDLRGAWWAWGVLTAVAGVMALSLLATTAHWLSDVVAGTFLGVALILATVAWRGPRRTAGP